MNWLHTARTLVLLIVLLWLYACKVETEKNLEIDNAHIKAINESDLAEGKQTIAITGVLLIDGNGGEPLSNAIVIVKGNTIEAIGTTENVQVPEDAEVIDGSGLTLMPGLIDAHYHGDSPRVAIRFLQNGVTSARDPGAWIEDYEDVFEATQPIPRLFLTGPHFDNFPPAYPRNSVIVRDPIEARNHVQLFFDQGASAIKVYFRTSPELIQVICEKADELRIPTTAHLEIAYATDAIEAGIDGVEHVTSFGIDLVPRQRAERYRQAVLADNNARRDGRYQMWSEIDLNTPQAEELIKRIIENQVVISPTLAIFEYRLGEGKSDTTKHLGFEKMMGFVGKAKEAGASVVVGSHTWVPYAEFGFAYQREMEVLAESGLSNAEVIEAATMENARFLRIDHRLGSIEKGKQADLILVNGNPLEDIKATYNIEKVMLNGVWVSTAQSK